MFRNTVFARFMLRFGTLNHLVFMSFVFSACAITDFTCEGDGAVRLFVVYGALLIWPQIVVETICLSMLAVVLINAESRSELRIDVSVFVTTLAIAIFSTQLL